MTTGSVQVHVNAVGAVMGGAARHLDPFLRALHDARPGWRLHVWVYEGVPTAGWPEGAQAHEVAWRSQLHRFRWENIDLPRALRRGGADVLVNLTNTTPVRCPVPSVLYQRNALWFDRLWVDRLRGRARIEAGFRRTLTFVQARGASVVVVPSEAMADFLRSWRGWPRQVPVHVVPHAVDPTRFGFAPQSWPPSSDRPLRLLAVGHDAPHKDQVLLVDLVGELRRRHHEVELTLTIGAEEPTGYVAELVNRCEAVGVGRFVHFVGRSHEVERLYRDADVALSSSITESFGFPLIEAMAVGVPVVASSIPTTVEVASGNAWLFAPGDVRGAADAVEATLAIDVADMRSRLARAREHATAFTWEANAGAVAGVVDRLLGLRTD